MKKKKKAIQVHEDSYTKQGEGSACLLRSQALYVLASGCVSDWAEGPPGPQSSSDTFILRAFAS